MKLAEAMLAALQAYRRISYPQMDDAWPASLTHLTLGRLENVRIFTMILLLLLCYCMRSRRLALSQVLHLLHSEMSSRPSRHPHHCFATLLTVSFIIIYLPKIFLRVKARVLR